MPKAPLHEAITRRVLGVKGTEVQKLMDSTAHAHGPSHRSDPIHTIYGVAMALAQKGELTPKNLQVAALHIITDQLLSEAYPRVLPKGPLRRPTKELLETVLVLALKPKKRRR